jgi:hypothetical protein
MTTTISSVIKGDYEITLDVEFTSNLLGTPELVKVSNYSFNHGAYVRFAEQMGSNIMRLWVEGFHSYPSFTLSVSGIQDSLGVDIDDSYEINLSDFGASLSGYSGLIRTDSSTRVVAADSERFYIAGDKGIDICNKLNPSSAATWAQVFNTNGIKSMWVANFGNTYVFEDTVSPYFLTRSPSPGGSITPDEHISFTLSDISSTVEVSKVKVYINSELIFNGAFNGFMSGYHGTVLLDYKQMIFEIFSEVGFGTGLFMIRVVAYDLLNNELDITYPIYIEEAEVLGFGLDPFGLGSFGGI